LPVVGKGKKVELQYAPPGVVEVDEASGQALIARGQALPIDARYEAPVAPQDGVTITREGDGPRIGKG
jgi:hypothetical protein